MCFDFYGKGGEKSPGLCYNRCMQTPIDFGKDFLNRFYDLRDADGCLQMLAGDLVWITPEDMHHFLSEGAVLKFLRRQISADAQARYVDIASMKSSPSAENIMTVAYEVNLVSGEDERPLHLRCSMAICRRGRRLEITFLHFSKRAERDSSEQLRDFVTSLPCGVMILACLDGQREEALFYNEYFAHRLRYRQEEFARAMAKNPFFMASEEDRDRIQEEIDRARKSGGSISANLRFYRRDGNSFYYRMTGAPAYQANGGTVYYCVFQETTGFRLTIDRLQGRLDSATELLRQIPEGICGIEYPVEEAPHAGGRGREPRVFFVSKNIPAMFGVSNSAFMKNILLDPCFGLEMTSITRNRILESGIFDRGRAGAAGPVSLGIFRLKSAGRAGGRIPEPAPVKAGAGNGSFMHTGMKTGLDAETGAGDPAESGLSRDAAAAAATGSTAKTGTGQGPAPAVSAEGQLLPPRKDAGPLKDAGLQKDAGPQAAGAPPADGPADMYSGKVLPEKGKNAGRETDRIELVARRVCGKDRTVRLYLFYYNREEQQREQEERVDRAMKMGRAGQDQLRAELQRAKETAARLRSEHNAAIRAAQDKHDAEMARVEDQRLEEKNRAVLLSRRLEESRAAQKRMEDRLEEVKNDAARRIRSCEARADRKVKLAEEGLRDRETRAEEKVKGAFERLRRSEAEAEQKVDLAQKAVRKVEAARSLAEEQLREAQERARILEQKLQSERARRLLLEEQWENGGPLPIAHGNGQGEPLSVDLPGDWMAEADTLTVISAMDPAGSDDPAPGKTLFPFKVQQQSPLSSAGKQQRLLFSAGQQQGLLSSAGEQQSLLSSAGEQQGPLSSAGEQQGPLSSAGGQQGPLSSAGGQRDAALCQGTRKEEAGRQEQDLLREREFSPEECFRNVLSYGEEVCAEKEISLRPYRDSRLPLSVTGFGDLLLRALCELVKDAADHTQTGGTVSVHSRADRPSGGFVNLYFRIDCEGVLRQDQMKPVPESGVSAQVPGREEAYGPENLSGPGNSFGPGIAFGAGNSFEPGNAFGSGNENEPEPAGISAARQAAALMGGSIDTRSDSSGLHWSLAVTLRVQT